MFNFSLFGLFTFIIVLCTFTYFLHSADKSFLGKIKCITKMVLLFNIKEFYVIMITNIKYVHKGEAIPLTRLKSWFSAQLPSVNCDVYCTRVRSIYSSKQVITVERLSGLKYTIYDIYTYRNNQAAQKNVGLQYYKVIDNPCE